MVIAELKSANKIYKTGGTSVTALEKTNLSVNQGELLLIMGPSGSGKTTLLALLGCVIYPTEGQIILNGQQTNRLNSVQLADVRLKEIGFVFQTFNLLAPLNVLENIAFPLLLGGKISRKKALQLASDVIDKVGLTHKRTSMPNQLSGGEQQRVAIARALVTNPAILLCDEPTAALDADTFNKIMEEFRFLAHQGKAVVIVTHDQKLLKFADRVINVDRGVVSEVH
jgi:putative ABC transport system ATP-binding protein